MLKVNSSVLRVSGFPVTEPIFIRDIPFVGEGKKIKGSENISLNLQAICRKEKDFNEAKELTGDGTDAPIILIDGLIDTIKLSIPAVDLTEHVNVAYYNNLLKIYLIDELKIDEADITQM